MAHSNSTTGIFHGWQAQPDTRGTWDILKSCGGTILLLCWSSVSPNVPGPHSRSSAWRMKLALFGLAILGPEFNLVAAVGELNAAWKAKKAFRLYHTEQNGSEEVPKEEGPWNLRQCFFANMGGIHLHFQDQEASFPVDCGQLLYLLRHRYIQLPLVPCSEIDARNKADVVTRLLAMVQTAWFSIDVCVRVGQGLHVTTLELTTLSFALLMTACNICWYRKPMDIDGPIVFEMEGNLQDILNDITRKSPFATQTDPQADPRFGRTPLSFLNRREWFMSKFWSYYCQLLTNVLRPLTSFCTRRKPYREEQTAFPNHPHAHRFPAVYFRETDFEWELLLVPLFSAYAIIFMCAWNFPFPTQIEQTLWRASSVGNLVYSVLGSILAGLYQQSSRNDSLLSRFRRRRSDRKRRKPESVTREQISATGQSEDLEMTPFTTDTPSTTTLTNSTDTLRRKSKRWFSWMQNISPDQDPALDIPAPFWITITILCVTYAWSRAYILAEDVAGLRSLPASAFQMVNWGQYSPIF